MNDLRLCRFQTANNPSRVGLVRPDNSIVDLSAAGVQTVESLLEDANLVAILEELSRRNLPTRHANEVRFLAPVERQEVWAAGVTYLRSKKARMDESEFSASAYDRVYDAERPEIFFKSLPEKVVPPGEEVGIRGDARWNVPEPELALVLNSRGAVVGFTAGNDMSSRDIEGENLLYLPQAKTYHRSCAVGPCIRVGATEEEARTWTIQLDIIRAGTPVFQGRTDVNQIKRRFAELAEFLFRCQVFPNGAVLLTGTGIVPPDSFTLEAGDQVRIEISGIGVLSNEVVVV